MKQNIYLDIDGVLLVNDKQSAHYAEEFLRHVASNYTVFWLTTHCQGDASVPVRRFGHLFSPETVDAMRRIQPTKWDIAKTEAINFNRPFLWFDDDLYPEEKDDLLRNNALESWVEVDLVKNPRALEELYRKHFYMHDVRFGRSTI